MEWLDGVGGWLASVYQGGGKDVLNVALGGLIAFGVARWQMGKQLADARQARAEEREQARLDREEERAESREREVLEGLELLSRQLIAFGNALDKHEVATLESDDKSLPPSLVDLFLETCASVTLVLNLALRSGFNNVADSLIDWLWQYKVEQNVTTAEIATLFGLLDIFTTDLRAADALLSGARDYDFTGDHASFRVAGRHCRIQWEPGRRAYEVVPVKEAS